MNQATNKTLPAVSVIVPVYKVERFLPACLDSLCAQTMQDIEILLVDDGSPDSCGRICDEYAARDARMKVFHTDNHGLSAARNYGIERAQGSYLMFVDSDDWVSPEFCAAAYDTVQATGADLVMFRFAKTDENGRTRRARRIDETAGFKSKEEGLDLLFTTVGNYAWNKIYRRELFEGVRYPVGRLYEDIGTTYKLICRAERIYLSDRILYFYRKRKTSITHVRSKEMFLEAHEMSREQLEALGKIGYSEEKIYAGMQNRAMTYCIKMGADPSDQKSVESLGWLGRIEGVPKFFSIRRKLLLAALRISPRLFDLICIVYGRRL